MTTPMLALRLVTACFAALAGFAVHSHLALLLGEPALGSGPLTSAAVAGLLGALRHPGPLPAPPPRRPTWGPLARWPVQRWATGIGALTLLAAGIALVLGVLGSAARDWDGAVGWELRARWLAVSPTLDQPFFDDVSVYAHTREYPLLQPLVHAQAIRLVGEPWARMIFPLLWMLLLGLSMATWRRLGGHWSWLMGGLLGATPMLVAPTSGGVDSGYAELAVATMLTCAAAGLVTRDRLLLFLGTVLLTLCKPEGALLAAGLVAVPWIRGHRGALLAAGGGILLALALWLPLHLRLLDARPDPVPILTAALGGTAAFVGLGLAMARLGTVRVRLVFLGALVLVGPLALAVSGWNAPGALGQHFANLGAWAARPERIPTILTGVATQFVAVNRFGLAWVLAAMLLVVARARRAGDPATTDLAALLGWGLGWACLAGLTTPETDLPHFLRSSLDRLLLQQTGVLWLLIGASLTRATTPQPFPSETHQPTTG